MQFNFRINSRNGRTTSWLVVCSIKGWVCNRLRQRRIASKGKLWGKCPIVGNQRPRVLTNGQYSRLFIRISQKGQMPGKAGFANPKKRSEANLNRR